MTVAETTLCGREILVDSEQRIAHIFLELCVSMYLMIKVCWQVPSEGNAEQSSCERPSRDILLIAAYMINLAQRPSRTFTTQKLSEV